MADYVVAGICFNGKGAETAEKLSEVLQYWKKDDNINVNWVSTDDIESEAVEKLNVTARQWTADNFKQTDVFIYVGPPVIAVRCFGLFISDQMHDPAVIVVDESCRFSIPLLSGRRGEAFELAALFEEKLGIRSVTADMDGADTGFDIEEYAEKNNMVVSNIDYAKEINAAIDSGAKVGFYTSFPIIGELPKGLERSLEGPLGLLITPSYLDAYFGHNLWLIPKVLTVSVACSGQFDIKVFEKLLSNMLNANNLYPESLAEIAVSDVLSQNFAIQAACMEKGVKMLKYNEFDMTVLIGNDDATDAEICEAAALYTSKGSLMCKAETEQGITIAIAIKNEYIRF